MSTLFFSNADYYKNKEFQRLMREWNNITIYTNEILNDQVKENLMYEFYRSAKSWYYIQCGMELAGKKLEWKCDLE